MSSSSVMVVLVAISTSVNAMGLLARYRPAVLHAPGGSGTPTEDAALQLSGRAAMRPHSAGAAAGLLVLLDGQALATGFFAAISGPGRRCTRVPLCVWIDPLAPGWVLRIHWLCPFLPVATPPRARALGSEPTRSHSPLPVRAMTSTVQTPSRLRIVMVRPCWAGAGRSL
jgi:hypothetical protein